MSCRDLLLTVCIGVLHDEGSPAQARGKRRAVGTVAAPRGIPVRSSVGSNCRRAASQFLKRHVTRPSGFWFVVSAGTRGHRHSQASWDLHGHLADGLQRTMPRNADRDDINAKRWILLSVPGS